MHTSSQRNQLREKALQASAMLWVPYSNFPVLAAVQTIDGRMYSGANIECANLTLTKHAEDGAISAAMNDGVLADLGRQWLAAVYVICASDAAPCGGCRQFLWEFAADDAIWYGENSASGNVHQAPIKDLLPLAFGPGDLNIS